MADKKPRWGKGSSGRARKMAITVCRSLTDVGVPEAAGSSVPLHNGRLPSPGISILDRLIKTCPVWLQLCMSSKRAAAILSQEESGVFLVTRDVKAKCMVLWVHLSERGDPADILHYNIREEKTMMHLEGSFLVFEDIFKLVGFYCVSRDILPSPLRLPHVITRAQTLRELEVISNLGTGFWDSIKDKRGSLISQPGKLPSCSHVRRSDASHSPEASNTPVDCSCEIELSAGSDKLWFVNPIFIEECGNVQNSSRLPPLTNCVAKPDSQLPKVVYRRPPPPPPLSLHKPPLPSLPPSAPPPNYIPLSGSSPVSFPAVTSQVSSGSSEPSDSRSLPESPSLLSSSELPVNTVFQCSPTNLPSEELLISALNASSTENFTSASSTPNPPVLQPLPPSVGVLSLCSSGELLSTESKAVQKDFPLDSPPTSECQSDNSSFSLNAQNLNQAEDVSLTYDVSSSLSTPQDLNLAEDCLKRSAEVSLSTIPTLNQSEDSPGRFEDTSCLSTPQNLNQAENLSVKSSDTSSSPSVLYQSEDSAGSTAALSPPSNLNGAGDSSNVSSLTSTPQNLTQSTSYEGSVIVDPSVEMKINSLEEKKDIAVNDMPEEVTKIQTPVRPPPAVPKRRLSGKIPENANALSVKRDAPGKPCPASSQPKNSMAEGDLILVKQVASHVSSNRSLQEKTVCSPGAQPKKPAPIPPPRKKKLSSRHSSVESGQGKQYPKSSQEVAKISNVKIRDIKEHQRRSLPPQALKGSDSSLNSPKSGLNSQLSNPEGDSYSTSSADEDSERMAPASIKKSHSFMLDRAKNRLSVMSFTNVFSAFLSADRKLQKRIVELAHDKDTYFGNLVQDYKAYSLEMMAKQSSSTEMLQEIRLMMTQLKSYLVQSTELKSIVDYNLYTDEKIDAIVEAALCKCVLKPLKSPIECYLRDIHNKDGSLRLLTENQLVIQDTTTTDLGVTTSVPDSAVMEKIVQKFGTMHKTYSPEKKITYLLKACKLIYDSMATGNPGKPHGADDFLPVLMYVLARCDLAALLLDVEYMMELMDPALQLGEGSYYLTTTYGALEHIKNYDKITVTRQLSVEVQDSIHRWERRRTLNKARVSRSSIQDFITISFEELDANTRTLATKADTTVTQVLQQCAEKFGVSDPPQYGLFVLVNEQSYRLAGDALPQRVKSHLLKTEQKLDFHFLYKTASEEDAVVKDLDFL